MPVESDELVENQPGPSGGAGGAPFAMDPGSGHICKLVVRHGSHIDAIGLAWDDDPETIEMYGGDGGTRVEKDLEPGEVVTEISGRYGSRLDSLVIRTNKHVWSFGGGGGASRYSYSIAQGLTFAGFSGRCGSEVDALGVILQPRINSNGPALVKQGPSGGTGGVELEDVLPPRARLTSVRVRHGSRIDAIGISYELDGATFDMPMHGGDGGDESTFTIPAGKLLVGISGRYGSAIDSLTLHLSDGSSETYGGDGGTAGFGYRLAHMEIVGFHGHSGSRLDSLGPVFRYSSTVP